MAPSIREFGVPISGIDYVLRPGGYAVIFNSSGEVATVLISQGLMLPGGGHMHFESPAEAAIRETLEECGLRIQIKHTIGTGDELVFAAEDQTHYRKRCTFFIATVIGTQEKREPDHELLWLSANQAKARLLHESQRWAISEALLLSASKKTHF